MLISSLRHGSNICVLLELYALSIQAVMEAMRSSLFRGTLELLVMLGGSKKDHRRERFDWSGFRSIAA